jgi:hypothetical protein
LFESLDGKIDTETMTGFNKMYVMIPVMLAARKIDGENPDTVFWLRVAYAVVQTVILLLVAYTYVHASMAAKGKDQSKVVYVPPPPQVCLISLACLLLSISENTNRLIFPHQIHDSQPFADPKGKKKYTETLFGSHVLNQARSLLGSTLFGLCLTLGLHYYRGMVIGLAIQAIMGPLNMAENALIKALVVGDGIKPGIFGDKTAEQLTDDDEVVDAQGNPVARALTRNGQKKTFEEILLDTWDDGAKADLRPLMSAISKKNCNYSTKENGWTPLMILSGLGVKGSASAIRQVLELGGDPAKVDSEGWNALHWAAFHGSVEGAKALRDEIQLLSVKDKEGKTPLMHARAEGNEEVAKILEKMEEINGDKAKPEDDEGLRKRK